MRLRCISAVTNNSSNTFFQPGGSITVDINGNNFTFEGEADIYNITPDDSGDNAIYTYNVLPLIDPNNPGSLVLDSVNLSSGVSSSEVLIDGKYQPRLVFAHHCPAGGGACDEPNFITVTLSLHEPIENIDVSRTEGIRFWFLDVVR